jgi:hypothetical protein
MAREKNTTLDLGGEGVLLKTTALLRGVNNSVMTPRKCYYFYYVAMRDFL